MTGAIRSPEDDEREPLMLKSTVMTIIDDLRPVRRPARVLYSAAAVWVTIGALHLIPLAADGWDWSGSVSFRKPIVFSVSMGLLLATVGWVLDRLPERRRLAGALAWSFLVSTSIEITLITIQAWRGRASHFNVFEAGDAMMFAGMGIAVAVMSLCLLTLFVWSLIQRPSDPLVRTAVIGGLALVLTGLGIGQMMIELGNEFVAANQVVPEMVTVGANGEPKFPHAVAFHGIQVFILAAVMLRQGVMTGSEQRRSMRIVFWSYTAALVLASVQTMLGRGPIEPTIWSAGQATALIVLAGTFVGIVRSVSAGASAERQESARVR